LEKIYKRKKVRISFEALLATIDLTRVNLSLMQPTISALSMEKFEQVLL
jgi:hypothetical protein